jgi:hypothetical protein
MNYVKKEFPLNTKVVIHSVDGPLASKTGVILGKSNVNVVDHYIVLLDDPLPEALAISIIEHCLEAK